MFTAAFWKTTAEYVLVAFLTAFAGAWTQSSAVTLKDLYAALVAGGMAALYALIKQLGGVQATAQVLKVKVGSRSPIH
jgi:hypothetical protein